MIRPKMLSLVLVILAGLGCQTTSVSTVWKTPDPLPPPFAKVVTLVVNATPAERRAAEEELAARLRPGQGVAGHTLISDADLANRDRVRDILKNGGIDGAVVLRLTGVDERTTYYPPTYNSYYAYHSYYDEFVSYSPGYAVTDRIVRAEVSVYSVRDERLLWAGSSSTANPSDVRNLASDIAKAAAEELKRQGMLR